MSIRRSPALLLGSLLVATCSRGPDIPPNTGPAATLEQPNVLLITIDTTRADYIGAYGNGEVRTPNIDALAAAGALFLRNVATTQTTNPSHASILTGLHLAHHGMYDNQTRLTGDAVTLAEVLGAAGYATLGAVSAPHLAPRHSGLGQGFDHFLETNPTHPIRAEKRNEDVLPALRRLASGRFFAWLHYFDPHGDYDPPAPYDTLYARRDDHDPVPAHPAMDLAPEKKQGSVDPDECIALYKGEITYLDHHIGDVLALLEELHIDDRTLVVLVADHGESMGEHEIYFCHAGMYEQVLHVPLVMRLPGRLPAGLKVESLTSSVDLFPTILDLVGLGLGETAATSTAEALVDGVSLTPAFGDPSFVPHEFVLAEAVNGVIAAIYREGFKYIKPYPSDWAMPEDHLFHLAVDEAETEDIKAADVGRAEEMALQLDQWIESARAAGLPSIRQEDLDPELEKALRSLGYIR